MAPAKGRELSPEHKAAMADGRRQSRIVSKYLEALDTHKPKRGRRRTKESIAAKLSKIESQMAEVSQIKRLELVQERINLEKAMAGLDEEFDITGLEQDFAAVAAAYGQSKGISYSAWREIGVAPSVLEQAGIRRGA